MKWADEARKLGVRTNADTPHDAAVARNFGAEGIGLCRTEHMFFEGDRIKAVREMILADDLAGRKKALAKLLPMQREDFYGIFKAMEGYGVTIRLLDPPLHEFVPHEEENQREMAKEMGISVEASKPKSTPCMNSTRCWATAAAVWASPIRKSPKCRPARSSRRPASSRKKA